MGTVKGNSEERKVNAVTVGVDIGQRRDPTAIAVIEHEVRYDGTGGSQRTHHLARYLERLALGTAYPDVARRVEQIVRGLPGGAGAGPRLYVDATGVGTPIVDALRAGGVGRSVRLVPVFFTHGDRRTNKGAEVMLGKAWLVSRMQTLLQSGTLHLPRTHEAEALGKELLDYEIKVSEDANDRYGAFKVGTHDDLVTALGLAVQEDRQVVGATSDRGDGPTFGDFPGSDPWMSW